MEGEPTASSFDGCGRHYAKDAWSKHIFQHALQTNRDIEIEWRGAEYHTHCGYTFGDGEMDQRDDVSMWHQDGANTPYVITWATNAPTEIRLPTGEIFIPEPYHVIVFDNQKVHHRTGRVGYNAATREFARCFVHHDSDYDPFISDHIRLNYSNSVWRPDPARMIYPHYLTWNSHSGMV